jgi:hypothetical protein
MGSDSIIAPLFSKHKIPPGQGFRLRKQQTYGHQGLGFRLGQLKKQRPELVFVKPDKNKQGC